MFRWVFALFISFFSVMEANEFKKTLIIGYELDNKEYLSMGVVTKSGYILTSSDFFSKNNIKKDITVYVYDSDFTQPTCFMKARVKAVDFDRNMALLEGDGYLDVFCNEMSSQSEYHKKFLESAMIDFFCGECKYFPDILESVRYVEFDKEGLLVSKKSENLGYFFKDEKDFGYVVGFVVDHNPLYPGTPYFDKDGNLMGMYVFGKFADIGFDGALSKGFITSYICELENASVIQTPHKLCEGFEDSELFGIIEEK
ncbi:MAG: hypothetical protein ACLFQJ_07940 [Campylobacterales bacterium]